MYIGTSSVHSQILHLNNYIGLLSNDDVTRTSPAIPSLLFEYDTVSRTALTMHGMLINDDAVSKTALATPGVLYEVFHPLLLLYVLLYHSTTTVCSVWYQIMKWSCLFYTKLWNVVVCFIPSYEM